MYFFKADFPFPRRRGPITIFGVSARDAAVLRSMDPLPDGLVIAGLAEVTKSKLSNILLFSNEFPPSAGQSKAGNFLKFIEYLLYFFRISLLQLNLL